MLPYDHSLPDEPPMIGEPDEGQDGLPQNRGFTEGTFAFWSRLIVWSQLAAIPVLGLFARYEWMVRDRFVWEVLALIFNIVAILTVYGGVLAAIVLSLGSPRLRSGCLLVILEAALFIAANIALLPAVQ